ncbi:NepR family anti-sigma factor [Rhizobium sp. L1K21]|uniref:NepR family anti-sigma factor n=1 Tax=Rhizobium sp. L1K21 TaxID=2954933 RepID=UPI00359425EB
MVDRQKRDTPPLAGSSEPTTDFATDGIATRLRDLFSEIENEGIPDKLVHLLDKLDKAEKAQNSNENQRED